MTEFRQMPTGEVRDVDPGRREFIARAVNYDKADTYGSVWRPGVFTRSLERGKTKAVYSHDWQRPIGKVIGFEEGRDGLDLRVKMADPDAVPDSRMVMSLLEDGILDQFSFGFERVPGGDERVPPAESRAYGELPAREYITEAVMNEVSPVLIGSVPGTRLVGVRMPLTVGVASDLAYLVRENILSATQAREAAASFEIQSAVTVGDAVELSEPAAEPAPETPPAPPVPDNAPEVPPMPEVPAEPAAAPAMDPAEDTADRSVDEPDAGTLAQQYDALVREGLAAIKAGDAGAGVRQIEDATAVCVHLFDALGVEQPPVIEVREPESAEVDLELAAAIAKLEEKFARR